MPAGTVQQALDLIARGSAGDGVQMLREVAATGDPEGLYLLGDLTWSGTLVPQDQARGRLLYEAAATSGHSFANLLVTNLLGNGIAGKRNWPLALHRLNEEGRSLPQRRRGIKLIKAMNLDPDGDPLSWVPGTAVSDTPHVRLFDAAMTPAECAYLIDVAQPELMPSMVYNESREMIRDPIRTSDGASFHGAIEDPVIHALNRRVAAMTASQYEQGETLQVLRYSPGQQYRPHFDYVESLENKRIWTALLYLNEEYGGGQTTFVNAGLSVRGKTGQMLLFRNMLPSGERDPLTKHSGESVTRGTKFLATRWIRQRRWLP